jgi:hypothetical protein
MANRNQHFVLLLIMLWNLNHNNVIEALTARACKDGVINLICNVGETIQVTNIRLYDSSCVGSNCCPATNDCNGAASSSHTSAVQSSCNGQRKCAVNVETRDIGCGWLAPRNDYETITYDCLNGPTTATTTMTTTRATTTAATETRVPSSTANRKSDSGLDPTSPNLHLATNDGQTIREMVSTDFPAKATVWIAETVTGTPDGPQTSKDSLYDPKYLSDSQTIQDQSFLTSQHSDVPESFSHQVATDGDLKIVQYSSDVSDQMALSHSVESFVSTDLPPTVLVAHDVTNASKDSQTSYDSSSAQNQLSDGRTVSDQGFFANDHSDIPTSSSLEVTKTDKDLLIAHSPDFIFLLTLAPSLETVGR